MKIDKKFFNDLEKQIKKDWGKPCWTLSNHKPKDFSPLCGVCQIWLAYYSLKDLYQIDYKKI